MHFDVVVVGAGAAGLAASIGAAATGARVCLIEKFGFLGGAATTSSVLTYCGFFDQKGKQVVRGVGQDLLDRLAREDLYRTHRVASTGNTVVLLDQETLKRVLDEMVVASGITLLLHSTVIGAQVDGSMLKDITVAHRGGLMTITADAFVDASGDGILISTAGADQLLAAPDRRQASTLVMRVAGLNELGKHAGPEELARAVESYSAASGVRLPRKAGIDVEMPIVGDHMMLLADQHEDVLDVAELTRAELSARQTAWHYLRAFRQYLSGWEEAYLLQTGPQLGIRETRRILGQTTITASDVIEGSRLPVTSIGRGGWPVEDHSSPGEPQYARIAGGGYFDLPYGALVSRSHDNLWAAGRLTSADSTAFASIRVMGTSFATGHAAGVAAALGAPFEKPSDVEVDAVRRELIEQGAVL